MKRGPFDYRRLLYDFCWPKTLTEPVCMSMPQIVILFGVAACGKTSVGLSLAKSLGFRFLDADDFHSAENVDKMSKGVALNDGDRLPWLFALHDAISDSELDTVLACSALKRTYRSILVHGRSSPCVSEMEIDVEISRNAPKPGLNCLESLFNDDDVSTRPPSKKWPTFIHLRGSKETILGRMMKRSGHFMPTQLITSQFEALEEIDADEREELTHANLYAVEISRPIEEIVRELITFLGH